MTVPSEVLKLIAESGNSFHSRVARWIHADGWHVSVSPYYMDQSLNKAREIDLVAEKFWPVSSWNNRPVGDVAVRLFIECKFVPAHSVFWFTDKDMDAARQMVCAEGVFRPDNSNTAKHHYLSRSSRVAKVFAATVSRGQENDPYYRALNQVLNATVAMRGGPLAHPDLRNRRNAPMAVLEFPVIVCSSFSQIYGVDFFADSEAKTVDDNFQLEIQYAYLGPAGERRNEHLLLDFVDFARLPEFMRGIADDAETAAFFLEKG